MTETMVIIYNFRGLVREEKEGIWAALCRSLDVASQGNSEQEAKDNLQEAVTLWIDSCVERGTLGKALRELGFNRTLAGSPAPPEADSLTVQHFAEIETDAYKGTSFPIEVVVPAYQIAAFG